MFCNKNLFASSNEEQNGNFFGQLEIVEERYEKLNELLSDPDVVSDTKKLMEYSKEQRSIEKQ